MKSAIWRRSAKRAVNEIQNQVKVVSADTEAAGQRGREEVEKGRAIAQDLLRIAADLQDVQVNCGEIRKSAAEVLSGVKSYSKGAEQVAAAADEATAACHQTQKSAQEQTKAYAEMGDAARSLAEMAEELKTSPNGQNSAAELAATAEELSSNAAELKFASQQISIAIEQISKAAGAQAKSADAANALGAQLRLAARAMGERAELSVERAVATQQLLATNKANVESAIRNIGKGAEAAAESSKNIMELQERTRRIDKIVDAIVMVTVQTKMLAVNGNVEAARAGEYGRGFSVVADDIRSLANESSENTDRIKDLIKSVQGQIAKVAVEIEQGGSRARAEAERAKISSASLERIAKDADEVVHGMKEIARGAVEVAVALEQAGKASAQIATSAEETAIATREAVSASEQGAKAAKEISQATEEIAAQADELQTV